MHQTLGHPLCFIDWVWWFRPEIPAFRRWSPENHEFKVILRFVGKQVRVLDAAA